MLMLTYDPTGVYRAGREKPDDNRLRLACGLVFNWVSWWDAEGRHRHETLQDAFNEVYAHGGGWQPMDGWDLSDEGVLMYKPDGEVPSEPYFPYVRMRTPTETVYIYPSAWVAIVRGDSHEIARMD